MVAGAAAALAPECEMAAEGGAVSPSEARQGAHPQFTDRTGVCIPAGSHSRTLFMP